MGNTENQIITGLEEALALDLDKVDAAVDDLVRALGGCTGIFFSNSNKICITVEDVETE